jgi:hypothetical protein
METIMTLVLEESEDISIELLTPMLANVKKDNEVTYTFDWQYASPCSQLYQFGDILPLQEVLPVARKLAERVLESSATKLKPYLIQAVETLGISFDDYSKVVASICQETSGTAEQNEDHAAGIDMVILLIVSR